MQLNLNLGIIFLLLTSCVHKQQSDDLMEMTEFSQKSEAPLNTNTSSLNNDNEVQRDENGNIIEEPALTREKIRDLHMILHRYAKKINLEKNIEPAELGYQHEEIIQTLAGLPESERTSLVKSVLTLAVFEKSVYSFFQSKQPPGHGAPSRYSNPNKSGDPSNEMVPNSGENSGENSGKNNGENLAEEPEEEPVELFEESDAPEMTENLDVLVRNFDIDVTEVLRKNRLLAFPYIHNFILIALENMVVSEDLKEDVQGAIKDVSTPWVEIYKALAPEEFNALANTVETNNEKESSSNTKVIKPAIPYLAGDFAEGEDQLNKAKKLANKHLYSEAITTLESINEDSPYFNTKKEMIKKYSNLAVKSLRRKAAQSFQSAIPAPGLDAKLGYLKEAESHLIDAVEEYPDADQLEKVKENLSIIQKRISEIEDELDKDH